MQRGRGRSGRWGQALTLAASLAPTLALAHPGDHAAMGLSQVAHHIATSPDHLAELVIAGLFALGGAVRLARRARR
ncbi:MAG: hypothetical protein JF588_04960 [Caulobacterales bacterium]|nr:hypothetical protein [Caulobacterales bacterium]